MRRIAERPLAEYHPHVAALWRSRHEEPESEEFDGLPGWAQEGLDQHEKADLERMVAYLLTTLTKREVLGLLRRYWMDETLEEVGRGIFTSRERVRQIEAKALRKLRHPSRTVLLAMATDLPDWRWHRWDEVLDGYSKLVPPERFMEWIKENPRSSVGYCFPM